MKMFSQPSRSASSQRWPMLVCSVLLGALAVGGATLKAPAQPDAQTAQAAAQPDYIWWEAENPKATNFPPAAQNPFAPANEQEAEVLSEGKWIGATGDRAQALFLEYDVTVPRAGRYNFYARKFWQHGPFRWRFDGGAWTEVRNTALLDSAEIRLHTVANWVSAGSAQLAAGRHTLRIETLENTGAAAFDAFVLTAAPFTPRGKLKPGQKYNRAPQGWFAFEPDPDPFKQSAIDLRALNEKFAGEGGFIQARGEEFVRSTTGRPIRFWAINTGGETMNLDRASVDLMARSLAKSGVNMIRIHGGLWGSDLRAVNREHLDKLFYFVAAMKRQGIYTTLSIYFPLWMQPKAETGYAGYTGNKHPFALLFFNEDFQRSYRGWWKAALSTPNPYAGGKTLSQDPAVAVCELVNEDSYLFWTFNPDNIPAPQMALLQKQFGGWLAKKYGSLAEAKKAWGGADIAGDVAAEGRAGFMPLWEIFSKKDRRAQDTAAFLTLSQKMFFEETRDYLKKDLGFKGSIHGSNWITADATILGPLDKWSNTGLDFMDRHGYFGGRHEGERAGYSLSKGDKYADRSALLFEPNKPGEAPDYSLPIMDIRYNGLPSTITEINWPMPNRFRADLPLLAAAYGVLQGTDALYFFATGSAWWEDTHNKFGLRTPAIMGQFPAAALLYRNGLVKAGDVVVEVNRTVADIMALKGVPVSAPLNLDELRAKDIPASKTAEANVDKLDPLAFLVGKVAINFTQNARPSRIADLSKFIDRKNGVVRSASGELMWNYNGGLMTVNAPRAQAATGFLNRAKGIVLGDVTIATSMEYGTVMVVALDGRPLSQSSRMLLQVMSEDANFGWQTRDDGNGLREITSLGAAPIVVKNFEGTVAFKRADAGQLKVTTLDFNGYRGKALGSAKSIALTPNTLYYLIEK